MIAAPFLIDHFGDAIMSGKSAVLALSRIRTGASSDPACSQRYADRAFARFLPHFEALPESQRARVSSILAEEWACLTTPAPPRVVHIPPQTPCFLHQLPGPCGPRHAE